MKYWASVLRYALYLLVLSSIFVRFSHTSWAQFGSDFLIRMAIVVPFAAITLRILRSETVEPYRVTEITAERRDETEARQVESPDGPAILQPQAICKGSRSFLIFAALVLAIFCLSQTSWWNHQAWIDKTLEIAIRWAICFACWGTIALLWMPKPDANQPETYHIVPSGAVSDHL